MVDPPERERDVPDEAWCEEFAVSHGPDAIVLVDPALRVVWANAAAGRLLGHRVEDFRGAPMIEFVHPEDLDHATGAISEASRNDGYHIATRLRLAHRDGGHIDCRVTANTVEQGTGTWFVLGVRSVGEEDAIESRRRRLRGLATSFYVDCASMEWMDEPERSRALLGGLAAVLDAEAISVAELTEASGELHTITAWRSGAPSDLPERGERTQARDIERLRSVPCEYTFEDGRFTAQVWLSSTVGSDGVVLIDLGDHPEQWDDANADVVSLMCSSLLGTVRRCSRERAVAMAATRDPLTGLLNRTAMGERLEELMSISRLGGESLAVFFADLNDFKALNDTAGHHAGDQVLCTVADALRGAIRPGDLAARVGGDEFVVVMMTRRRSLDRLTHRLRESLESAIDPATGVGVAIGAILVRDGESPEEVLARADVAMYADKRRGASTGQAGLVRAGAGALLSTAMESLAIMLAVDADGRLLTATRAAYSVFGFAPESADSMNVLELVHPEEKSFAAAALSNAVEHPGVGEPIEIRVIDADGGCHSVHVAANNQLANPDIRGIVLTLTDTSASQQIQRTGR